MATSPAAPLTDYALRRVAEDFARHWDVRPARRGCVARERGGSRVLTAGSPEVLRVHLLAARFADVWAGLGR